MRVLVCGGTGYIGSHTALVLAERGHDLVLLDNYSNSSPAVLERLYQISGQHFDFCQVDLREREAVFALFKTKTFDAVIHFAGLKAVGESCEQPLDYFDNNIGGSLNLLQAMQKAAVKHLVFSSSATVYGHPEKVPVKEDAPLSVSNPYGRSKLVIEQMLGDIAVSGSGLKPAILRYFNPVGAHPSGLLGEAPSGIPNNLMPYICQVAAGVREKLSVFGGDWPTVDGSGVRDFIHVMDLARAHADALDALTRNKTGFTVNLGTGTGISVLQLVQTFERVTGRPVPYQITARRAGDVAEVYADSRLAKQRLGWQTELDIEAMCRDAWRWQQNQTA
ncbi:UDP-glucose 4-epimerase [Ventosimonas gracilis]|uniref:UDP-glucose 4-epimerase n=1 Tax=Ventosimonas gracilis TaxID=1680762 RepID=A0A139SRU0_9GAMM|nr:UDP-glucose 4-epimerase GalE [Ventosimonas gracilis]KXU37257.1 UDP-glucose 4-epimerase [Ventosimonas gracilis]